LVAGLYLLQRNGLGNNSESQTKKAVPVFISEYEHFPAGGLQIIVATVKIVSKHRLTKY